MTRFSLLTAISGPTLPRSSRIGNDCGLVYEIDNPEFRQEPHTFTLTRAGRIRGRVYEGAPR